MSVSRQMKLVAALTFWIDLLLTGCTFQTPMPTQTLTSLKAYLRARVTKVDADSYVKIPLTQIPLMVALWSKIDVYFRRMRQGYPYMLRSLSTNK